MRSDAELVHAVLTGQLEAFADLVRRYERTVRATALDVLGDHHAAQDVTQDAFVAAYEKLGTLRDAAAFGGWTVRIARNRALSAARRRSNRQAMELPPDVPVHPPNGQLDERSQRLLRTVMKLPEHERTVVMLRYFEGHTVQVVADMTGRPVGTVTAQLARARDRLRQRLKEFKP